MLTSLDFEVAGGVSREVPDRADVACFVGQVARRPGVPLPAATRAYLRDRGWIDGPWDPGSARLETLEQVPVVLESWQEFDRLFAWETRVVRANEPGRCASYLGAVVRSFFAHGGRKAIVVRTGDPWPYIGGDDRSVRRAERLGELVPARSGAPRPFDPRDPRTWRGIEHMYGLREVSHVCLPDLADVHSVELPPLSVAKEPPPTPETFVECSATEPAEEADRALRFVLAPRLDSDGFSAWADTVGGVRDFLSVHRRDANLVASLPLPMDEARAPTLQGGARARTEWLEFLLQTCVLDGEDCDGSGTAASAFVQLVWPWLSTTRSEDLPERLEPGEGLMAGVLAANALRRGTFRSVAGTRLSQVVTPRPVPEMGLGADSPTARLAERVCLIGHEPDGIRVLSDVTSSPDTAWRAGGVSRLMGVVLRAAQRVGEAELFEANGPEMWERVRHSMESLLEGFFQAGALRSSGREPPYQVRCGPSTMSQSDLDNGRVRAEITLQPSSPVERISVSLELTRGGAGAVLPEVA